MFQTDRSLFHGWAGNSPGELAAEVEKNPENRTCLVFSQHRESLKPTI